MLRGEEFILGNCNVGWSMHNGPSFQKNQSFCYDQWMERCKDFQHPEDILASDEVVDVWCTGMQYTKVYFERVSSNQAPQDRQKFQKKIGKIESISG